MRPRTAIGGLLLEGFAGWSFDFQHGAISASHERDPGILRITHILQNELPQPLTHERCLDVAAMLLDLPVEGATDRHLFESVCGPYGAASFRRGKDLLRLWYCRRPPGLILGVYACPAEFKDKAAYRFIIGDCAHIMTTALFDRPSWGGDDELTRVLIDNLEISQAREDDFPDELPPKPPPRRSVPKRPAR